MVDFPRDALSAVCKQVQAVASAKRIFGGESIVCEPEDAAFVTGSPEEMESDKLHRDCSSLRDDYGQLQFICCLQGVAKMRFETYKSTSQRRAKPRLQRVQRAVPAGHMLIFMGSRFAHVAQHTCTKREPKCIRVVGWLCVRGRRTVTEAGTALVSDS